MKNVNYVTLVVQLIKVSWLLKTVFSHPCLKSLSFMKAKVNCRDVVDSQWHLDRVYWVVHVHPSFHRGLFQISRNLLKTHVWRGGGGGGGLIRLI